MDRKYKVGGYVKLAKLWERSKDAAVAYHSSYYAERFRDDVDKRLVGVYFETENIYTLNPRIRGHPSELEWHQCRKHPQPLPECLSAGRSGRTERYDGNEVWKEVGYGIVI